MTPTPQHPTSSIFHCYPLPIHHLPPPPPPKNFDHTPWVGKYTRLYRDDAHGDYAATTPNVCIPERTGSSSRMQSCQLFERKSLPVSSEIAPGLPKIFTNLATTVYLYIFTEPF